jgi:molecular chaperone DnaJ
MVKKDYYEILGVKKTDSSETIKKHYKELALKFHPDKAGEDKKKEHEENFKEINEAYSTLGDSEKRKRYDAQQEGGFGQGSSFQSANFSDLLADLLRGGSFGSQFSDEEEPDEDQNLSYKLTIEFKQAVFGHETEILVKKNIFCKSCEGTGAKDKEFETCDNCAGQGRLKLNQKTPFGVISRIVSCDECNGEGQIYKNKCPDCHGAGIVNSKEKVKIKIPAGIDNGQTLRVRNGGNAKKNSGIGDLFLLIEVKPHKLFKRDEYDVSIDLVISFSQAALGDEVMVPTLSDEKIKIKIEKGTESGSILRLKGRGIPFLNDSRHFGDQFINIKVKTPKKLSSAQVKLFEELKKLD